ncbi:ABC transporter substrate-binding protein [Motiliproteus sp. MSK22-1]|uniref:ABC transporter substrate-binding protein n=1 Tax=Motiliproteus sp. MSK22-1 TaxID=1897630 RepID=UPI00097A5733|nr:ABC transporter substrate binding protein [Motiliproteus sp. MSK22-1]OMH25294.1 hypothetical protein BGP75_26200 [Motiliproteus sp. MSK22-1]
MIGRMANRPTLLLSLALLVLIAGIFGAGSANANEDKQAKKHNKVLVVMSYEEDFCWSKEIKEGIDSTLAKQSELTYFYMNTKTDLSGGAARAAEAYELYQKLKPDGVIAVDDNAQQLFVVPYLKAKVETPVMFCGVNAEPDEYGYPDINVSGVLERGHVKESISFLKQLMPSLSSVGFITNNSSSGRAVLKQIKKDSDHYGVNICGLTEVNNRNDLFEAAKKLDSFCDAVYIESTEGILDQGGDTLSYQQVLTDFTSIFRGPILGANQYHVAQGALAAVIKTGQEQGAKAASMLMRAMKGVPVAQLPITRNFKGRRVLNVSTMKALNLNPRPIIFRGTDFVRTQ